MQPIAGYSDSEVDPREGTRRYVYSMPGGVYLVIKVFRTSEGEKFTTKFWDETLDYQRTVRSWRTKHKFAPSYDEYLKYYRIACRMVEKAGFRAHAFVVSRSL